MIIWFFPSLLHVLSPRRFISVPKISISHANSLNFPNGVLMVLNIGMRRSLFDVLIKYRQRGANRAGSCSVGFLFCILLWGITH